MILPILYHTFGGKSRCVLGIPRKSEKNISIIFQKPLANFLCLWYNSSVVKSNADVAQLVEQLIRNQQVAGSSPAISSNRKACLDETGFSIGNDCWSEKSLQVAGKL